jgi:hypothetical protein
MVANERAWYCVVMCVWDREKWRVSNKLKSQEGGEVWEETKSPATKGQGTKVEQKMSRARQDCKLEYSTIPCASTELVFRVGLQRQ